MKISSITVALFTLSLFGMDPRLEQARTLGPQPLRDLIQAHLQIYPHSFPHDRIIYMPYLDNTIQTQSELVRRLNEMPSYREDFAARGTMHNFSIRVKTSYEIIAKEFDRRELDRLSVRMRDLLDEYDKHELLSGLRAQVRKEYDHLEELNDSWWTFGKRSQFNDAVIAYVFFSALTQQGNDLSILEQRLMLEEGTIDYLVEEARWKPALESIADSLGIRNEDFMKEAKRALTDGYQELKGSGRDLKFEAKAGEQLHLLEVHPDLAILRGFVGNDCSTDVSFGFPYSPFERTFYVMNSEKEFLGYVALSLIEARGKRAIYLHTIAGPEINHVLTDRILRGIFKAREVLGAELVFLPEDHRIGENINYHAIDEMMRRYVQKTASEKLVWLDHDYRKIISKMGSSKFYDSPERNQWGRELTFDFNPIKVKTEMVPLASPVSIENRLNDTKTSCQKLLSWF